MSVSTSPAMIALEVNAPRIASATTAADLNMDSGGTIEFSVPGASRALQVSTNEEDTITTLDSKSKKLRIVTPVLDLAGVHGGFEAATSIGIAAGSDSTLQATSSAATVGTGATEAEFSATQTHLRTGETSLRHIEGETRYRAARHNFSVGDASIVTMNDEKVTFHVDVDIEGTLNSITGDQTIMQVEDNVIQVATGTDTEAGLDGASAGIQIDTVPASSVAHVSKFRSDDGSASFLDAQGNVDVAKASASGAFVKQIAWNANGGSRTAAKATAESRLAEPAWDFAGGQVRMLRYVPDAATPGRVFMYAVVMRVTDAGNFEVSRMKQAFDWDAGSEAFSPGAPEYTVLQEAVSNLYAYASSISSKNGDSLDLTFELIKAVDPVSGPFMSMEDGRKVFTWKGKAPTLQARITTPIRTNGWTGLTLMVRARVQAFNSTTGSPRLLVVRGATGEFVIYQSDQNKLMFANSIDYAKKITTANAVPLNTWIVVSVTVDRASSEARFFVDGTNVGMAIVASTFHDYVTDISITSGVSFNGSVSDAFVWPRALSASELQSIGTQING